jgi:spore coat protein A
VNRRDLLKRAALYPLGLCARRDGLAMNRARALNAMQLEPFVDAMPVLRPVAREGLRALPSHSAGELPHYRITMREIYAKMHRDLAPTRLWSFGPEVIGPLLEARAHERLLIEWRNELPSRHFLPIDYSLHGSGHELPESRTVVHLHGGRTPASEDGYPTNWYSTGNSRVSRYPNQQDAAMLWYHDHAMGTSRLNLYAGLMGAYLLRDAPEQSLNLPSGEYELAMILYDRIFDREGQLFYPVSANPEHPWRDVVAGDAMVVNGRVRPFHEVEARRYRLRLLNAANGRFFRPSLSNGAEFVQIGADQGLLPRPVASAVLLLAPGERADVIVDFAKLRGERVVLTNGAFTMMQFRVGRTATEERSQVPQVLLPASRLRETAAARTRRMTLNEFKDPAGNTIVMLLNRTPWHMPVTEMAKLGSSEIWSLINLTEDTHPIHLHHVRFQVMDRRPFHRDTYLLQSATLRFTGNPFAPSANESGWKDVVQCPPGMVTRIHISFAGYPGQYLWHCHVQEHEANDMMRPFAIVE